jgi:hypothetical protein
MNAEPGKPKAGPLFHMLMTSTQDLLIISRSARLRDTSSLFDGVFMVEVLAYTNSTKRFPVKDDTIEIFYSGEI